MNLNQLNEPAFAKVLTTKSEILKQLEEAKASHLYSVNILPFFVKYAKEILQESNVLLCTVIGYPLGMNTTETKVFETLNAIHNGADEIEMVINYSEVKSGNYDSVLEEVNQVSKACAGHSFSIRIETSYLTEEEIVNISDKISNSGAKIIKTSIKFGPQGASERGYE